MNFQYPHPPTTEAALQAYEKQLGFQFPSDYRNFLLKYNGGGRPAHAIFDYKQPSGKTERSMVDVFFGLDIDEIDDINVQQDFQNQPDYLFLIGRDLGGLLCIGIRGDHHGKIYVWETSIGNDVVLLADNFNEFLEMLYSDEDE